MCRLSGTIADNRIDLLFLLYDCYREVLREKGITDKTADFDLFRSWGETVLSDFSDVDNHLADADQLFKNVADYNEISTDYLTDEQKERVRNFRQPEPVREVSLVVRNDYIRERMLNLLADSIRTIVPDSLVDPRLKKFAIKL